MLSKLKSFVASRNAATAPIFALSLIPVSIAAGAGLDFARVMKTKATVQAALDASVLSAVTRPEGERNASALGIFNPQLPADGSTIGTPSYVTNSNKSLTGTVQITIPSTLMKLLGKNTTNLTLTATAGAQQKDVSCILTRGGGLQITDDSLTFNGSPNVNLAGCSLHSNTSMTCNGHSTNATASIAVGSVTNCSNPQPNSPMVPDIYADIATNISRQCGTASYNLSWSSGSPPPSPRMITIVNNGVTEYHVCGNLTLSGSLTLGQTTADSLLVVENGTLTIDRNADVNLQRMAVVLTGTASTSHKIDFPNGKGHSATLKISPPKQNGNPWQGIAIYQDPALTANIDMNWGPGATLSVDGVMYFPNANMTIRGNADSGGSECTKLVVNDMTLNGSVNLKQSIAGCQDIGIKQYVRAPQLVY